jgi:hypothetical protein
MVGDSLEDMVAFLVVPEDLAAEDIVNLHRSAASAAIVEEDTEVVTARDIVEVMFRHSTMEDTTIPEEIMGVIAGTIIEDTPHREQPSGFFLVGPLLEVDTVNSGGLIML